VRPIEGSPAQVFLKGRLVPWLQDAVSDLFEGPGIDKEDSILRRRAILFGVVSWLE
jgi:hypothetical protein